MRLRRSDTADLFDDARAAFHALWWWRFVATRRTKGPRLVALGDRSTEALAKLPPDLAEYVLAYEADEIHPYGSVLEVLARRCAQQAQ